MLIVVVDAHFVKIRTHSLHMLPNPKHQRFSAVVQYFGGVSQPGLLSNTYICRLSQACVYSMTRLVVICPVPLTSPSIYHPPLLAVFDAKEASFSMNGHC